MSQNIALVEDFISAWNEMDFERVMSFFTPDCVYHNIPMPVAEGTEAIAAIVNSLGGMASSIEWVVHHIAETSSGVVLTERTDKFQVGDKAVALPVMGTFELRDDKISAWRDYFDLAQFQSQMPS